MPTPTTILCPACSGRGYHELPATHDEPTCERDCAACEGTGVEDLDADCPEADEWLPGPSWGQTPHMAVHRGTPECEVCGAHEGHPIHKTASLYGGAR